MISPYQLMGGTRAVNSAAAAATYHAPNMWGPTRGTVCTHQMGVEPNGYPVLHSLERQNGCIGAIPTLRRQEPITLRERVLTPDKSGENSKRG